MNELRTERTVGVTKKLTPVAMRNLYVLANSETWTDLLDVLEMTVIEIETTLINTPVENKIAVLENHKLSQAAWTIFEKMQMKIVEAGNAYLSEVAPQSVGQRRTAEEEEMDYLLNPTMFPSNGTTPEPDGHEER